MVTPLLQTKFYIPNVRPELVPRPRLINRLNAGLPRKLTLISAPAGFGKTTLVSEWIGQLDHPVAWLSLDESDNDPTRFLAYLIAALQPIAADIGKGMLSAVQSPRPPPVEAILTALINEITALTNRIILILDDYHLIDAQPVHDALTFLLRHLPLQMHLVIATREDPPLPLARLRARGQLTELRATNLRFTSSEAAEFLNQVIGPDLSEKDIAALERRTEGWIAGLQLAAVSMQGRKDVTSFIQSFTGSHHYVLDYLIEEVLDRQSEDIQAFLLQTAILDRLSGSLCDALTGQQNGHATVEMLQRANLFIVPLDGERRWYRYHYLFADLLRQRLQREQGDLVHELHQRASKWYEESGLLLEAVKHALAGADFRQASELIERIAWAMLMRGEVTTLLHWLHVLPDAVVCASSELVILQAWALALTGQLDDAEARLSSVHLPHDRGEAAALRGYLAHHRLEAVQAIECCQQALRLLPEEQWFPRGVAAVILGTTPLRTGDPVAASRAFAQAVELGQTISQTYLTVIAMTGLGEAQHMQGLLSQADQTYREALQLACGHSTEPGPFAGMTYVGLAGLLYERNKLDEAMCCVTKGIELSKQAGSVDTLEDGYFHLALLRRALGNAKGALEALQEVENMAQRGEHSDWMAKACAFRSQWWLQQGNMEAASRCAQESRLCAPDKADIAYEFGEIAAARVLIARAVSPGASESDDVNQALRSLAGLLQAAEAAARMGSTIKILGLNALAFQAQSDMHPCMSALERALSLAEPEGYVRIFVDEGPLMARLLYEALSRGIEPDYVRRLLAAFPTAEPQPVDPSATQAPASDLIEPLSEREIEILQRIAEGLTNQEIASRLFLSLHTIKAHARNIYSKLGVHNRTEAVARARALGILSAD